MKLNLRYHSEKTKVDVQGEAVEVKAYQVIVWVSLSSKAPSNPVGPRFPAILDIGHTHNFALTENQLRMWCGIPSVSLPQLGWMRKEGKRIPLYRPKLWLHTDGEPFPLPLDDGIAVSDDAWPRLPILGLRADKKSPPNLYLRRHPAGAHSYAAALVLAVLTRSVRVRSDSNS